MRRCKCKIRMRNKSNIIRGRNHGVVIKIGCMFGWIEFLIGFECSPFVGLSQTEATNATAKTYWRLRMLSLARRALSGRGAL